MARKQGPLPKSIAAQVGNLPEGIVVSDLWRGSRPRTGSRWLFRVRDPLARDGKGRPVYITKAWPDYAAGESWAKDEHAKVRLGMTTAATARMSELGPSYVKTLVARKRTERYRGQVDQVWKSMVAAGADDLKDPLVHQRVERWLSTLTACRRGQKVATPASARTRNQFLVIVNAIIAHGMSLPDRPLAFNPIASVKRWPQTTKARGVFTVAELRKLVSEESRMRPQRQYDATLRAVEAADDNKQAAAKALGVHVTTVYYRLNEGPRGEDPWWLYTMLGIYTGARPTEVRHLAWEHIDWHNGDIVIPADHPGNKTRTVRRLPMFADLRAVLQERVRVGQRGPILPADLVGMSESTASKGFQFYVGRCGIDATGRGPHTLRHNCGALLTACGVQDVAVLLHLGHESVAVSKEYRRSAPGFRNDVAGWDGEIRLRAAAARPAKRKTR